MTVSITATALSSTFWQAPPAQLFESFDQRHQLQIVQPIPRRQAGDRESRRSIASRINSANCSENGKASLRMRARRVSIG